MEISSAKLSELKTPRKDAKSNYFQTKHALHVLYIGTKFSANLPTVATVYPLEILIFLEKISERHLSLLICLGILQQTSQPT
jgi:hypothetical protein